LYLKVLISIAPPFYTFAPILGDSSIAVSLPNLLPVKSILFGILPPYKVEQRGV